MASIVDGLVKGPVIPDGDKAALRRFADKTARDLATLESLDCGASHHTLLHIPKKTKWENDQKSARGDGAGKKANSDNIAFLEDLDAVLLQVVPLRVFVKLRKAVTTYAMLDSWSEIDTGRHFTNVKPRYERTA